MPVISNALQIAKSQIVLCIVDIVTAVSLVTGEIHAIHYVQQIVSEQSVTKAVVPVHKDAHRDGMETRVI